MGGGEFVPGEEGDVDGEEGVGEGEFLGCIARLVLHINSWDGEEVHT